MTQYRSYLWRGYNIQLGTLNLTEGIGAQTTTGLEKYHTLTRRGVCALHLFAFRLLFKTVCE